MVNGRYRTDRMKSIDGPALITYVYRNSAVWALFTGGHNLQGCKVEVKPGLFVPKGVTLAIDGEEPVISFVEPSGEPTLR